MSQIISCPLFVQHVSNSKQNPILCVRLGQIKWSNSFNVSEFTAWYPLDVTPINWDTSNLLSLPALPGVLGSFSLTDLLRSSSMNSSMRWDCQHVTYFYHLLSLVSAIFAQLKILPRGQSSRRVVDLAVPPLALTTSRDFPFANPPAARQGVAGSQATAPGSLEGRPLGPSPGRPWAPLAPLAGRAAARCCASAGSGPTAPRSVGRRSTARGKRSTHRQLTSGCTAWRPASRLGAERFGLLVMEVLFRTRPPVDLWHT